MKILGQDFKRELLEKKKGILLDAANLGKEQQTFLRAEFEQNFILESKTTPDGVVKDVIQLLYNKKLFNSY